MDEYKDKKGNKPEELEDNQLQGSILEESDAREKGLSLFSHDISRHHKPLENDAEIEEQLAYVEARLEKYYQSKAHKKALESKVKRLEPLEKIDGNINVETLKNILSKSAIGEALIQGNNERSAELVIDDQIFGVSLHKKLGKIGIHHQMTYGEALYLTAKSLRRAWLSLDSDMLYPLSYLPDDAVLMNRILEADCRIFAVWIAWELKLQSETDMWDHIIQSDDATMAVAFAERAKKSFVNLENGEAARASFNAWFTSYNIKPSDHALIQSMLSDEKGYVFTSSEPPLSITHDLLEAIGQIPQGGNYMNGMEEKPLPGTEYGIVRDRSNANFLWFVKFEKSFQETELKMLEEEREEQKRKENIEKSKNCADDISKIAEKDEKIVDFAKHFRPQSEGDVQSLQSDEIHENQVLGKEKSKPAPVTYLFDE